MKKKAFTLLFSIISVLLIHAQQIDLRVTNTYSNNTVWVNSNYQNWISGDYSVMMTIKADGEWPKKTDSLTKALDILFVDDLTGFVLGPFCDDGAKLKERDVIWSTKKTTLEKSMNQPYASLPFAEGFNNTWINKDNTRDVPSVYWRNDPSVGENSWRRNDDGISANWSTDGGAYTPGGANNTTNSARFHSFNSYPSGVTGIFDLHLDFSSTLGGKTLSFWYINSSGSDKLEVFISENGGETFGESIFMQVTTTSWEEKEIDLGEVFSEEVIIRFKATSDWGYSDIGIDEIAVQQSQSTTIPTVTTLDITNVSQYSATGGGNVIDEGGTSVTSRGIVWSISENPTIELYDGITYDGSGIGTFESILSGLAVNTTYYVKAYATNSNGTAYGDIVNFTTPDVAALPLPVTEGFEDSSFPPSGWISYIGSNGLGTNQNWFRLTTTSNSGLACAAINFENVTGGMAEDWLVTPKIKLNESNNKLKYFEKQSYSSDYGSQFKIKVSTTSQTDHSTFTDIFTYAESDFGTTWTSRSIDLDNFADQNVYIAIVYINDDGDNWLVDDIQVCEEVVDAPVAAFTSSVNSGYIPLTVNFTDQSSNNPTSWSWNFGDGNTSTQQNPSHIYTTAGVYTVTLTATNSGGNDTETKSNYISANAIVVPTISTAAVTSITQTTAVSGGNITNNGGASVSARGAVWGTTENPSLESNVGLTTNGTGNGTFTSNITELSAGTTYYVRAYATNSVGTAYGNQLSFTTLATSVDFNAFNDISAYPNPFENGLTIESENGVRSIIIINIIGQVVYNVQYNGEIKTSLDLRDLNEGIYILRIIGINGKTVNHKVIKK